MEEELGKKNALRKVSFFFFFFFFLGGGGGGVEEAVLSVGKCLILKQDDTLSCIIWLLNCIINFPYVAIFPWKESSSRNNHVTVCVQQLLIVYCLLCEVFM